MKLTQRGVTLAVDEITRYFDDKYIQAESKTQSEEG
jgi:hypothetical protein